jgi:uncharacterized membrane protein YtjA (UPF0391 family)
LEIRAWQRKSADFDCAGLWGERSWMDQPGRRIMLRWALIFLIFALIAGVFGFGGIAGDAAWIARVLFIVFIVLFLVGLIRRGGGPPIA